MTQIPRPVRITFLLTEEESNRLRKLASAEGKTVSEWLRDKIRAGDAVMRQPRIK